MKGDRWNAPEEHTFWPAFTDLISSVALALFLFMVLAMLQTSNVNRERVEGKVSVQDVFKRRVELTRQILREIGGLKLDTSATLRFEGNLLFAFNSAELTDEGKAKLEPLAHRLVEALARYGDDIQSVMVEGHTAGPATVDSLERQWQLSAQRAAAVIWYMQQVEPRLREPRYARYLTAVAHNYYLPPEDSAFRDGRLGQCGGDECNPIRRIEIRLLMNDEALKQEILKALEEK